MANSDMETMQRNATTIVMADLMRAYLRPGKAFGSLSQFIGLTIRMEPSRIFYISSPGGEVQAPNDNAARVICAQTCGALLANLRDKDPKKFNQATDYINGKGLREAEAFLKSPK